MAYPLLNSLSKGDWNDFVVHIHWSLAAGAITVWHRTSSAASYTKILEIGNVPTLQA